MNEYVPRHERVISSKNLEVNFARHFKKAQVLPKVKNIITGFGRAFHNK